jgi:HEAT repeat protein
MAEEESAREAVAAKTAEALQQLASEDPYQQQMGFLRLEALRDPATLATIRRYLADDNPDLRAYSLRAVAAIQGLAAVPELLDRLQRDRHPMVRRAALLGLEPLMEQDARVLPACIAALRDRHPEVRMTAADVVSRVEDVRARDAIRERWKQERQRDVRRVLNMARTRMAQ